MTELYQHRQVGIVTILVIGLSAIFTAFALVSALQSAEGLSTTVLLVTGLVVTGVFILTLMAFYAFTIQITDRTVSFWFGWGVGKQSLPFDTIQSVEIVRNPWYYLWGVKSIPGGWLYSIAPGGRALELVLKDHRKIRLGTDQVEEVQLRLKQAMKLSP
jgi:hypothetical protein